MENKSIETLKKRSDFVQISREGRRTHVSSYLLINFKESDPSSVKVGWTIPKYVGTAVIRNRFKRWCREFFRRQPELSLSGVQMNIIFKRHPKDFFKGLSHQEFDGALEYGLKKLNRLTKHK